MRLYLFDKDSNNNNYLGNYDISSDAKGIIRDVNSKDYFYIKSDNYLYKYDVSGDTEIQSDVTSINNDYEPTLVLNRDGSILCYINSTEGEISLFDTSDMTLIATKSISTTSAKRPIISRLEDKLFYVNTKLNYIDLSDDSKISTVGNVKSLYILAQNNTDLYTIDSTEDKLIKYSINSDGSIGDGSGGSDYIEIKDYTLDSIYEFVDININSNGYIILLYRDTEFTSKIDIINTNGTVLNSVTLNGVYKWLSLDSYDNIYVSRNDAVISAVYKYNSDLSSVEEIVKDIYIDVPGLDSLGYIQSTITGAI